MAYNDFSSNVKRRRAAVQTEKPFMTQLLTKLFVPIMLCNNFIVIIIKCFKRNAC
jgi:hypothetical protein